MEPQLFGALTAAAGVFDARVYRGVCGLQSALEARDHLATQIAGENLLNTLSSRLRVGQQTVRQPSAQLDSNTCKRLRSFIHDKVADDLSLSELAEQAGLGSHQFLAAFGQSFGESPWQYVIRQRLRGARRMLESSNCDLTSVALANGFSSHSHLSSTFKHCFGLTPSAYRKAL